MLMPEKPKKSWAAFPKTGQSAVRAAFRDGECRKVAEKAAEMPPGHSRRGGGAKECTAPHRTRPESPDLGQENSKKKTDRTPDHIFALGAFETDEQRFCAKSRVDSEVVGCERGSRQSPQQSGGGVQRSEGREFPYF